MPQRSPENERNTSKKKSIGDYANIPKIKTYASDMAKAIRKGQGSLIRMAVDEHRKRETAAGEKKQKPGRTGITILAILIFIVALAIAGVIFFMSAPQHTPATQTRTPHALLAADAHTNIDTTAQPDILERIPQRLATEARSWPLEERPGLEHIYFTETTPNGEARIDAATFLNRSTHNTAGVLRNSLGATYMYGVYHTQEGRRDIPFLLLSVEDYDIIYEALRLWENNNMAADMNRLFHIHIEPGGTYANARIANEFTRTYQAPQTDKPAFYYQFITDSLLLFTTHPRGITEIRSRYTEARIR